MDDSTVLVTGGAGFIGSHTCKQLSTAGFHPISFDNLTNGHRHNVKWGPLIVGDVLDTAALYDTLMTYRPIAVVHFAASAYVGESIERPDLYYRNNVSGAISLLSAMRRAGISKIVFSSTCATYGIPDKTPIIETTQQLPINPYGSSKLMVEKILDDYYCAYDLRYAALRYFNAAGADLEGDLSEEHDPETHLIPRCMQALSGLIDFVEVFGQDYPTMDGTCIRDYIHVSDLAAGHVKALEYLRSGGRPIKVNLGTGRGISIKEIFGEIHRLIGRKVPHIFGSRRPGDPPILLADPTRAQELLGFTPNHSDLETIIRTAWRKYS